MSTLRVQNDGFFDEPPFDAQELAVLRIHENPAVDQQHIVAPRFDDQRGDAVGHAVVHEGVVGQVDLGPLRLAIAHHLLLGVEPGPENPLADETRAAFGGDFIAKAAGHVEIGPDIHPAAGAEMLAGGFETAQRAVLGRALLVAREEALDDRRRALLRERRRPDTGADRD